MAGSYYCKGGERERWIECRHGLRVDAKILSSAPDPATRLEKVETFVCVEEDTGTAGPSPDLSSVPEAYRHLVGKKLRCAWEMRTYSCVELFQLLRSVEHLYELVACHDFDYNVERRQDPREDDTQLAVVLVLRKLTPA
jgi:hypothetical protein